MRNFLSVAILLCSITSFAAAGGDQGGSGGDPLLIYAKKYSNLAQLTAAIQIAKNNVQKTYPNLYKDFSEEVDDLTAKDYFLVLPSLVILKDVQVEGYDPVEDMHSFYELGSYTKSKRGNAVYFSERVLKYSPQDLATDITHEIMHHILPDAVNEEHLVRDLTASIKTGTPDDYVSRSLRANIVIRPGYVSGKGLYQNVLKQLELRFNDIRHPIRPYLVSMPAMEHLAKVQNAYNLNIDDLQDTLKASLSHLAPSSTGAFIVAIHVIAEITLSLHPESDFIEETKRGIPYVNSCRKWKLVFFWQKCVDSVTGGELWVP